MQGYKGIRVFFIISQKNQKRVKKLSIHQVGKTINIVSKVTGTSCWAGNNTLWSTSLNAKYVFSVFMNYTLNLVFIPNTKKCGTEETPTLA